jgi:hypothetical protein
MAINPPGLEEYNLLSSTGDSLPPGSGPVLKLEFEVSDTTPEGYYHFYITEDALYAPNHKPVFTIPLRGKFFVPSPPPVSIVCTPIGDTLLTPGDTLTFNSTLTNHSDSTKSPKFFIYGTTTGPDSFTFLAVDTTEILQLPPGGRKRDITDLEVPSQAPIGHYIFTAYVVNIKDTIMDEDPFGFQVVSGSGRPGYSGNQLTSSDKMSPWRVIRGWFGYNERSNEGFKEGIASILLPKSFSISQNYPNPFNPSTSIEYAIPEGQSNVHVIISIYDIRGRLVKTLVEGDRSPGVYKVHWNGTNTMDNKVSSGVYIYKIVIGDFVSTRKMVLVR